MSVESCRRQRPNIWKQSRNGQRHKVSNNEKIQCYICMCFKFSLVGVGDGRRPIECFFGPVQSELGHHWRKQWFVIGIQWPGFVNLCKYFKAVYAEHQYLYICLRPSDLLITLQSVVVSCCFSSYFEVFIFNLLLGNSSAMKLCWWL